MQALDRGVAVFCQKPLARTAQENRQVIDCAKRANRLLGVDLSYRYVDGVDDMRQRIRSGELGKIFAAELVFHNAYGPDKAWFYDAGLSGGGCLMDLGIHLVDLAHWILGSHPPRRLCSYLVAQGKRISGRDGQVEDYADVHWETPDEARVRVTCSWRLSAGCDAVIKATFYGSLGGMVLENVDGSFYDLVVAQLQGTRRQVVAGPSSDWGGKALLAWVSRLTEDGSYDPDVESLVDVAAVLDHSYGRNGNPEDPE
jgi:predicted dehydrogenase